MLKVRSLASPCGYVSFRFSFLNYRFSTAVKLRQKVLFWWMSLCERAILGLEWTQTCWMLSAETCYLSLFQDSPDLSHLPWCSLTIFLCYARNCCLLTYRMWWFFLLRDQADLTSGSVKGFESSNPFVLAVVEWFVLEGAFKDPPAMEQGHLQLDEVAQSPIQPGLEWL